MASNLKTKDKTIADLQKELQQLKKRNDKLVSENTDLMKIKSDYENMSEMFGQFSVQFMESRGLSPTCKICHEIYDTNLHFQATLKCGHTFGENCIRDSLQSNGRCPVCNKRANASDINRVY
ncbi:Oidioi.mRNA.OKI2018_I69.chr2.g4599.t1.cds [Oikopleura dioica]|uniref:Oidioi.mRNA.OKI2018_I69.chr2.g4599.t1.cds n=1 Tax=Oikopleura dioica TaxID=34765 RepID=A0ABN7T194_OIKDI|nr:Oidioi.mRNA.OKI2018_I69.chr2.g4599.t1.cds [Oikopleura dioica]